MRFHIPKSFIPSNIYYMLVLTGYFVTMFLPGFRTGLFASAIMVIMIIRLGLNIFKSDNIKKYRTLMNISVLIYFLYNLLSFVWVLINGYPVSIYIAEFSNSVLPVVFFFEAALSNGDKEKGDFYKYFLYSFVIFGIVSIIFYLWAPDFYCRFLYNSSLISKADKPTARVRMESFMGSTTLSYLGVAAMVISAKFAIGNIKKKRVFYSALFLFSLAVVFLANGRAGMVAAILAIIILNILVFFKFDIIHKKYFYVELGIIIAAVAAMCIVTPGIVSKIMARLVSLPGAIGQRSEQWISAINNMHGQWFGNGLGVNGHKALNFEGAHVVADGGLIKLYCEEGALGFSLFVFIMLKLFINGMKNLKDNYAELIVIFLTLLMSIGSNIIAFQLCVPVFYYMAGALSPKVNDV